MTATAPMAAQAGCSKPRAWLAKTTMPAAIVTRAAMKPSSARERSGSFGKGRSGVGGWRQASLATQISQANRAATAVASVRSTSCGRASVSVIAAPTAKMKIRGPGAPKRQRRQISR